MARLASAFSARIPVRTGARGQSGCCYRRIFKKTIVYTSYSTVAAVHVLTSKKIKNLCHPETMTEEYTSHKGIKPIHIIVQASASQGNVIALFYALYST